MRRACRTCGAEAAEGADGVTYATIDSVTIHHGRCEDVLPTLGDSSVSAVVTDPPYFRVKNEAWDRAWDKPESFLSWLGTQCDEWSRLMRPNGSLYCFASSEMSARVEMEISKRLRVLNRITWVKGDGTENNGGMWSRQKKDSLRSFFPQTESIVFAEHFGADSHAKGESGYGRKCDELRGFVFEPLRAYLENARIDAGVSRDQCNEACGTASMAARHYFSRSQWCLPTKEHYEALRRLFDGHLRREYEDLRREYEDLRREYEDLRREYEDLRRPFSVTADVPYTDVWSFSTVQSYAGKHPCEKPVSMMKHLIKTSTRDADMVIDPFAGSGTTGVAALMLGRSCLLVEQNEKWCEVAATRLEAVRDAEPLFAEAS